MEKRLCGLSPPFGDMKGGLWDHIRVFVPVFTGERVVLIHVRVGETMRVEVHSDRRTISVRCRVNINGQLRSSGVSLSPGFALVLVRMFPVRSEAAVPQAGSRMRSRFAG